MPEQYANRANISSRINVAACRRQLRNPIGMMKAMFRQWRCHVNRIDYAGGCSFCNKELGGNGSYPNATANTSLSALFPVTVNGVPISSGVNVRQQSPIDRGERTYRSVPITSLNRLVQARKNATLSHSCKLKVMVLICKEQSAASGSQFSVYLDRPSRCNACSCVMSRTRWAWLFRT